MSEDPTEPVADDARPTLGVFPERFEPGDEIGRGGMGRVVEARDKMLGRTVALKEALATDEDALRRFARETQITARLEHPSIVPVYDAGVSPEGSPFYVMRKVTGRPLGDLIDAARSLPERLALLPHMLAACQAIAHAHERGIIHRDLKPANILVGAHGETIVIDWGLAKAIDETDEPRTVQPLAADSLATRAGTVMGTPGFMSPEQHAGDDVDERADVYALGATLHYVLAGKLPPSPLPGVPNELRTIVDKALAHDLAARYRNAAALAEDLARFTTGQLVAAHDYSTRERIARFVRRHRALVITIAAAAVVIAVGAWIAVGRIIRARDEALAQARVAERARAAEAERASDLVVSQARLLLATNPTGAVAMVRPLAATSRWREVRAIAAGARAAGVARSLPGPETATYADISDAGTHVVLCGTDGSVHVYDLAARTHAIVAKLTGKVRAQLAGEDRVIAWVGDTFTIIDIATKTQTTLPQPRPIHTIDTTSDTVYVIDEDRAAWQLRLPGGERTPIPLSGKAGAVAVSPDGKRVAFGGEHLWLLDANHPELVEKIHDGKKFDLAWSTASDHLAAVGPNATYDVTVHPEIEVEEYRLANQSIALARGQLYTSGLAGLTAGDRMVGEGDLAASLVGLHVTRGDFVVAAGTDSLKLFDGKHEHAVALPARPASLLLASPRAPYIFAIVGNRPMVWNIDDVMPQRIEVPAYSQMVTVGPDRAWTITNSGPARAIDMHTGASTELVKLQPMRYVAPASGAFVLAMPLVTRDALVIRPDGTSDVIAPHVGFATVLDDRRVVVAADHELYVHELATKQRTRIGTYAGDVERVITREVAPRWVVVTQRDGQVSRHDLQTGKATETKLPARSDKFSPGLAATAATTAGDVFLANEMRVSRWRPDGSLVEHVTLPRPVRVLHLLDDRWVLAVVEDGTAYAIGTAEPRFVKLPAIGHNVTWSAADPSLLVTDDGTGGVTVIDLEAAAGWKIARATPASSTPDISGDGTAIILRDATLDSTGVALWQLRLPTSPAATAAWIDDMTNATFDPRTGMLGWPP